MNIPGNLNILDLVILVVLTLFIIRGAFNGLLKEITGLAGVIAGIWLAGLFYPQLGEIVHQWTGSKWSDAVAYIFLLCAMLIAVSVIAMLIGMFLKMTKTLWVDHIGGALIGFVKGFAIVSLLVVAIKFLLRILLQSDPYIIEKSVLTPYIIKGLSYLKDVLPDFFNIIF